ncbi:MAG: hypothetical protein H7332_03255 [Bdellovibrionales bacterium]|nr:hypothetical protein [Ramlibacter sp.]
MTVGGNQTGLEASSIEHEELRWGALRESDVWRAYWDALAEVRRWESTDDNGVPTEMAARDAKLGAAKTRLASVEAMLSTASSGKPELATRMRQRLIFEWLCKEGFDVKALPMERSGIARVKAKARRALVTGRGIFGGKTSTVFNHAWETLRATGDIAYKADD